MTKSFSVAAALCLVSFTAACSGNIEQRPAASTPPIGTISSQASDEGSAVRLVATVVRERKLSALPEHCLRFNIVGDDVSAYHIDVRELHDNMCGGDPQTGPCLLSFVVDKTSGAVTADRR